MLGSDGAEQFFNILKRQQAFKIVDKDQHKHVFFGIFLFYRWREKIVFGVIIDHGLGKDLVVWCSLNVLP